MPCAKIGITIFAAVILVFTLWPQIASASVDKWLAIIMAVLIILLTWIGTECKFCMNQTKSKR